MDSIPQDALDSCDCDPPPAPGIYAIINRVNQHVYVGSAKSLVDRKEHHFRDLKAGNHKNHHLQRAYNHYGSDAFCFIVLEAVEHVEDLLAREQHYIDTLNPEYNIARTAGSNLGISPSPETRAKMRAARLANEHMPAQMEKLNADRRGKHLSPEHRAKITANQLGRKLSPETRGKLRNAHLGKKKTPEHSANIRAGKMGHAVSEETRAKIRASKAGQKQSPETIAKRTAALRGRKHSPESIEKMRAAKLGKKNSPEARAKMSASRLGKKPSPETREKLRMRKNHLGHTHSSEARAKMKAAKLGKKQSPEAVAKRVAATRAKSFLNSNFSNRRSFDRPLVWQHTRKVRCHSLICPYTVRGNPVPRLRTHVVPCTRLLLTLASGADHFCQPLDIPTEVRLWLHPRIIGRSLSLSRYGCLQHRCCACHGVTHSMVGAFTVSREVLRQGLLPEAPNCKRLHPV